MSSTTNTTATAILLVEDSILDATLIEQLLSRETDSFTLERAESLLTARELLAHQRFDLVLLDLGLPDSHGLATLEELRTGSPALPVIVLTGNEDEEDGLAAVGMGAQDYLLKGEITGKSLIRAIRFAIQRGRTQPPPSDRDAARSDMDDALPLFGGTYQAERVIGRGAMGVVYVGNDRSLERRVAIKVLSPGVSGSTHGKQRFRQEAKTLAALEHPGIVPVYAFGRQADRDYFVMKYVDGDSLAKRASAPQLSLPTLLAALRTVFDGLDYLHEQGVVHRDLKPDNIVFDELGHGVLVDFGIASYDRESHVTLEGDLIGTPTYMSPEQAWDTPRIGPASDQYSLGVILYQLFAGVVPFQAETPVSVLYQHLNSELPPIAAGDVPPAVERALSRALAKDPGDRFGSCMELYRAITDIS